MNLYLCGMIGSGKTTIGQAVSAETGLAFQDLDREMDARLGYSFHRLVAEQGWLPFRELEYSICKHFASLDHAIICLGGGTVRYEWNLDAIRGTGPIVLLEADEEVLIRRVSRADRPRVTPNTDLEQDIRNMWQTYADRYRNATDYTYRTDQKNLEQEVEDFLELLGTHEVFAGVVPNADED